MAEGEEVARSCPREVAEGEEVAEQPASKVLEQREEPQTSSQAEREEGTCDPKGGSDKSSDPTQGS